MRCSDFENELNQLLDERKPLELSVHARRHTETCADCREMLVGFRAFSLLDTCSLLDICEPNPSSCRPNQGSHRAVASTPKHVSPKQHTPKHSEQSIRLSDKRFNKPQRPNKLVSLEPSQIPVAVPESVTSTPQNRSTQNRSTHSAHWNLKAAIFALVPVAAAVYVLGLSLFSPSNPSTLSPDWQAATSPSSGQNLTASNGLGLAQVGPNQLANFDWNKTAKDFDSGWRGIAVQRAGVCQLPGTQAYFYPINGAVEAIRTNVIVPSEKKEERK